MTKSKAEAKAKPQGEPVGDAAPGETGATHAGDSTSTPLVNPQPAPRTIDTGRP